MVLISLFDHSFTSSGLIITVVMLNGALLFNFFILDTNQINGDRLDSSK